jgi:hypothetical protein
VKVNLKGKDCEEGNGTGSGSFRIAVMNLMSSAVTVLDVNWTEWALM